MAGTCGTTQWELRTLPLSSSGSLWVLTWPLIEVCARKEDVSVHPTDCQLSLQEYLSSRISKLASLVLAIILCMCDHSEPAPEKWPPPLPGDTKLSTWAPWICTGNVTLGYEPIWLFSQGLVGSFHSSSWDLNFYNLFWSSGTIRLTQELGNKMATLFAALMDWRIKL